MSVTIIVQKLTKKNKNKKNHVMNFSVFLQMVVSIKVHYQHLLWQSESRKTQE